MIGMLSVPHDGAGDGALRDVDWSRRFVPLVVSGGVVRAASPWPFRRDVVYGPSARVGTGPSMSCAPETAVSLAKFEPAIGNDREHHCHSVSMSGGDAAAHQPNQHPTAVADGRPQTTSNHQRRSTRSRRRNAARALPTGRLTTACLGASPRWRPGMASFDHRNAERAAHLPPSTFRPLAPDRTSALWSCATQSCIA
jgi:hypothetical protein